MNFRPVDDFVLPESHDNSLTPDPRQKNCRDKAGRHVAVAFEQLCGEGGYSAIPNRVLDLLRGVVSRNEYDVLMYIIRRTLCFHKLEDAISLSQFQSGIISRDGRRLDYGCGLKSSDTIHRALRELKARGFIEIHTTQTSYGGNGANRFILKYEAILAAFKVQELGGQVGQEDLTPASVTPGSQQETLLGNTPSSSQDEGVAQQMPPPYPTDVPPLSDNRIHKNKFQNQDQNQATPWVVDGSELKASTSLVMSSQAIALDCQLLTDFGFEPQQARRLAILASNHNKRAGYISGLIQYARNHSRTSPHGMVRRLIERGEERSLKIVHNQSPRFGGWLESGSQSRETSFNATEPGYKSYERLVEITNKTEYHHLPDCDSAVIEKLALKHMASPVGLLKQLEAGEADEITVQQVLMRLGVYRRLEGEYYRACNRQPKKRRSA